MGLQFFEGNTAAPSGTAAGIFIPRTDLTGVTAGELADAVSVAIKTAKTLNGLFNKIFDYVSTAADTPLGVASTKSAIQSAGGDLFNRVFTFTFQFLANLSNDTVGVIPFPAIGANADTGKIAVANVFANAQILAAEAEVPAEGVVIPFADLDSYGAPAAIADISDGQDNRSWFAGLMLWLQDTIAVRATGVVSGVTAKSLGAVAGVTLAAAATDATNPTTGIAAADLNKISVFSRQVSLTLNYILNEGTQLFDVNVA